MPRRLQGSLAAIIPSAEPGRHRVRVAKDGHRWWVRSEGSPPRCYPTLTQAIHCGRMLAHQHKPSVLLIRHCSGEEERHEFEASAELEAMAAL